LLKRLDPLELDTRGKLANVVRRRRGAADLARSICVESTGAGVMVTKGANDISRLLEAERPDLVVDESLERELRRTDEDALRHFETVVVRAFRDLQALGVAPAELTEAHVRKAIADDDLEALRHAPLPCNCAEGHGGSTKPTSRVFFDELRSAQHPHLARLFSDKTGIEHGWDSIPVRVLAGAMSRLALHELYLELLLVRDIIVRSNATLFVDAAVSLLRARDIQLYVGARLVMAGACSKVVCRSVQGDLA
jgi:hypothetical protein